MEPSSINNIAKTMLNVDISWLANVILFFVFFLK